VPIYKKVNKNFFKIWNPEMSYVLGFFAADGNLIETKRGTHFISFDSADKGIIEYIKKAMEAEHKVSKRKSNEGVWYRLQIGSAEMFEDILKIGLKPNKSKRMRIPKIPDFVFGNFVRGYFDGDGNVWYGLMNKKDYKPRRVLQAMFTSASQGFLIDLHSKLKLYGIVGGSIRKIKNKECYRLQLSTSNALKLYQIMYNRRDTSNLFLKRKKDVFEKYMRL